MAFKPIRNVAIACAIFAGSVGQRADASPLQTQSTATESVSELAEVGPKDFPTLSELEQTGLSVDMASPAHQRAPIGIMGTAKLLFLVVAVMVWLRSLHLCSEYEDAVSQSDSTAWMQRLFWIGLVGIVAALIIPATLISIPLAFLTSFLPFWQFARWFNKKSPDTPRTVFQLFEKEPPQRRAAAQASEIELISGQSIGSSHANVVIFGKTGLSQNTVGSPRGGLGTPAFRHVIALIDHAVASRATDLHINTKATCVEIRQRIDGVLSSLGELPLDIGKGVISIFKISADVSIAERRRSQDGSFLADVNGRRLSFRISTQGTQTGEILSIRILDPARSFADFSSLGMPDQVRQNLNSQLTRSGGLILIVGNTGAGKSTTACAALQLIDSTTRNIVSIEDPIEYMLPKVEQIEVNYRTGQTFELALRSVLRMDADVIFIGEIRDEETAKIAAQAAQTGQLVVATMHANDSIAGAIRLSEMVYHSHGVANSLNAVLAQTLVRKLCPDCRESYNLDPAALEAVGLQGFEGPLYRSSDPGESECTGCGGRGFLTRTGLFELTEFTPAIRDLLIERLAASSMRTIAKENGMTPLREEGLRLVREGVISLGEFHRVLGSN